MSRATAFRFTQPSNVFAQQEAALAATMYIVREQGPTCFVIQEQQSEEEAKPKGYKVTLGDPHTCNCEYFKKERDLCKHILWLLLRRFRVERENQLGWQLGLVQREIDELVSGVERRRALAKRQQQQHQPASNATEAAVRQNAAGKEKGVEQRPINEEDVCPICQETLLGRRLPVCYCSQTCGNNVHLKCMKVWADHQRTNQQASLHADDNLNPVPCPMCRGTFCSYASLKQQFHNAESGSRVTRPNVPVVTVPCSNCRKQISSNEMHYRCAVCASSSNAVQDFIVCKLCFAQPVHLQHDKYEYRQKATGKWKPMNEPRSACIQVCALPNALAQQLMSRDISENDYDLLLQLDQGAASDPQKQIPESVVQRFRVLTINSSSKLLLPGMQCLICLKSYCENEQIKTLPRCRHQFHASCVTNWLLHHRSTCPTCGMLAWSREDDMPQKAAVASSSSKSSNGVQERSHLPSSVSSISLKKATSSINRTASAVSGLSVSGSRMTTSAVPLRPPPESMHSLSVTALRVQPSAASAETRVQMAQLAIGTGTKPSSSSPPKQRLRPPKPLYRVPSRDQSNAQQVSNTGQLSIAGSSNADAYASASVGNLATLQTDLSILQRLATIGNP